MPDDTGSPTLAEIKTQLTRIESKIDALDEDQSHVSTKMSKLLLREKRLRHALIELLALFAPEQTEDLRSELKTGHKLVEEAFDRILADANPDRFGHLTEETPEFGTEAWEEWIDEGRDENEE